jgi:hypothetical protein
LSDRGHLTVLATIALLAVAAMVATVWGCGDDAHSEESAPAAPREFFGVVPQGPLASEDLARMGDGNVGTVRSILPWGAIDPTPADDYDFATIDGIVLGAAQQGIEVLPFAYGTPTWVATELDGDTGCEPDCSAFIPRSPAALDAWQEFVTAAVERYGPGGSLWQENPDVEPKPIRAWQIWNEQNSPTFHRPRPDVAAYADLLAAAEEAIHARDPEATIVLGGMFATPLGGERPAFTAGDYLEQLYDAGADDDFGGVAVHPYAASVEGVEAQAEELHDVIARADDDATMWITEVGWASSGPDVPLNRGEDGQAERLTAAFDLFLNRRESWKIQVVTWYAWRDTIEPVCDWCAGAGLFPADALEPKPAWEAFVSLTGGE